VKHEFAFRAEGESEEVLAGVASFLEGEGYRRSPSLPQPAWRRGSVMARMLSPMIEDWPTALEVSVFDVGGGSQGVLMRYEVRSGLHLVGALDRLVLGAEAALLEEFLRSGRRRPLREAVAPVRRPVVLAAALNMVLATVVVVVVGIVAGYPPWIVALVAFAVAFLDGLVIVSFADLLLAGSLEIPRLRGSGPGPSGGPRPRREVRSEAHPLR
jgi:hypothetical protein